MILVTGHTGILGSALMKHPETHPYRRRLGEDHAVSNADSAAILGAGTYSAAILCAGTKGFNECDGNEEVFSNDVDGNIRLIRALLKNKVFVVFISTEAVERIGHRAAYSSNRLLVEQFLWTQDNNAIIRPRKFDKSNAGLLAGFCIHIAQNKKQGIHRCL